MSGGGVPDEIAAMREHVQGAGKEAPQFCLPALFRALERQGFARDYVGVRWADPLPRHFGHRLAGVSRKVSGISGLATLLQADFESHCDRDAAEQFDDNLRGRLFMALTELSHDALDVMSELSDALQERENSLGGAA